MFLNLKLQEKTNPWKISQFFIGDRKFEPTASYILCVSLPDKIAIIFALFAFYL